MFEEGSCHPPTRVQLGTITVCATGILMCFASPVFAFDGLSSISSSDQVADTSAVFSKTVSHSKKSKEVTLRSSEDIQAQSSSRLPVQSHSRQVGLQPPPSTSTPKPQPKPAYDPAASRIIKEVSPGIPASHGSAPTTPARDNASAAPAHGNSNAAVAPAHNAPAAPSRANAPVPSGGASSSAGSTNARPASRPVHKPVHKPSQRPGQQPSQQSVPVPNEQFNGQPNGPAQVLTPPDQLPPVEGDTGVITEQPVMDTQAVANLKNQIASRGATNAAKEIINAVNPEMLTALEANLRAVLEPKTEDQIAALKREEAAREASSHGVDNPQDIAAGATSYVGNQNSSTSTGSRGADKSHLSDANESSVANQHSATANSSDGAKEGTHRTPVGSDATSSSDKPNGPENQKNKEPGKNQINPVTFASTKPNPVVAEEPRVKNPVASPPPPGDPTYLQEMTITLISQALAGDPNVPLPSQFESLPIEVRNTVLADLLVKAHDGVLIQAFEDFILADLSAAAAEQATDEGALARSVNETFDGAFDNPVEDNNTLPVIGNTTNASSNTIVHNLGNPTDAISIVNDPVLTSDSDLGDPPETMITIDDLPQDWLSIWVKEKYGTQMNTVPKEDIEDQYLTIPSDQPVILNRPTQGNNPTSENDATQGNNQAAVNALEQGNNPTSANGTNQESNQAAVNALAQGNNQPATSSTSQNVGLNTTPNQGETQAGSPSTDGGTTQDASNALNDAVGLNQNNPSQVELADSNSRFHPEIVPLADKQPTRITPVVTTGIVDAKPTRPLELPKAPAIPMIIPQAIRIQNEQEPDAVFISVDSSSSASSAHDGNTVIIADGLQHNPIGHIPGSQTKPEQPPAEGSANGQNSEGVNNNGDVGLATKPITPVETTNNPVHNGQTEGSQVNIAQVKPEEIGTNQEENDKPEATNPEVTRPSGEESSKPGIYKPIPVHTEIRKPESGESNDLTTNVAQTVPTKPAANTQPETNADQNNNPTTNTAQTVPTKPAANTQPETNADQNNDPTTNTAEAASTKPAATKPAADAQEERKPQSSKPASDQNDNPTTNATEAASTKPAETKPAAKPDHWNGMGKPSEANAESKKPSSSARQENNSGTKPGKPHSSTIKPQTPKEDKATTAEQPKDNQGASDVQSGEFSSTVAKGQTNSETANGSLENTSGTVDSEQPAQETNAERHPLLGQQPDHPLLHNEELDVPLPPFLLAESRDVKRDLPRLYMWMESVNYDLERVLAGANPHHTLWDTNPTTQIDLGVIYIIQPGDNAWALMRKLWGTVASWEEQQGCWELLTAWNPALAEQKPNELVAGTQITIPADILR